ncbi:response regulator transcription factor [Thermus sp.]|jgi:DNA-binding response OmpR family regulator|nr:response regulator transcription factor [Thermus sp.]MDT7910173.1 response regulator transcription factor [Thermus sp.]
MRVLLLEDEEDLRQALLALLKGQGLEAVGAASLAEAREALVEAEPDLLVLDVILPEGEDAGFRFAEELRELGLEIPILFLTARDAVEDRVRGLDAGGDDYLVKPFAVEEFLARVRSLARRQAQRKRTRFQIGDLEVDLARRVVLKGGCPVDLTPKEFALLEAFLLEPQRTFTTEELLDRFFPNTGSGGALVRVYVKRLREKLGEGWILHTPSGYRLGQP